MDKRELIEELNTTNETDRLIELENKINGIEEYLDKILKCVSTNSKKDNIEAIKDLPSDNLKKKAKSQTFDSFDIDVFEDKSDILKYLGKVEEFIFNFEDEKFYNLLLFGNTGTGKTYLSNCAANEIINKGYTVRSYSIIELFDFIQEALMVNRQANLSEYKMLTECDLLIIDNLGVEMTNSFTRSYLFNILESRSNNYKKTILNSNLSIKDIANRYENRIFSIIFENYLCLKFTGEDIRWK